MIAPAPPTVSVLLSTFNGAAYLPRLLDSVLEQRYDSIELLIRDDGSADETVSLLQKYSAAYPGKITVMDTDSKNAGPKKSFSLLMKQVKENYIAFCDQDDVWLPEKIQKEMQVLTEAEKKYGKNCPILVFSDLAVVDENLKLLSPSFFSYSGLSPYYFKNNTILCRNVAPGCTMLFNRALLDLVADVPDEAVMHDYWTMLLASYKGKVIYLSETLIQYRQHQNNQIGVKELKPVKWSAVWRNFRWYLKGAVFYLDRFKPYQVQAKALLDKFNPGHSAYGSIRAFTELNPQSSRLKRKWLILRYGLKAGNFRDNIELLLCG